MIESLIPSRVDEALKAMEALKVVTPDNYETAVGFLKKVKETSNFITEYYEPQRVKAKAAYDEVLKSKKQWIDPLDKAERVVKKALSDYMIAEQAKAEKARLELEEKRLAEEAARKESGGEVTDELIEDVVPVADIPKVKGVSGVEKWDWEVVDFNLIPREYLTIDEVAINKAVRAMKDKTDIPGIKVKKGYSMRVGV